MHRNVRVEGTVINEEIDDLLVESIIHMLKEQKMTFHQAHQMMLKVRDKLDEMSQRVDL